VTNWAGLKNWRRLRTGGGFFLLEVVFSLFILLAMALMVAAVLPAAFRSVKTGNYYTLASQVAQRKLDQLMDPNVGYINLTKASLQSQGIISPDYPGSPTAGVYYDPTPTVTGTINTTGYHLVGYFTKIDGLRTSTTNESLNAFPGASAVLGTMDVSGWVGPTAASTNSRLMKVTVTITWKTNGQGASNYSQTALIPFNSIF